MFISPISAIPAFISFQRFVVLPKFNKSVVALGTKSWVNLTKSKSTVSVAVLPKSKLPPTVTLPGIVTLPVAVAFFLIRK